MKGNSYQVGMFDEENRLAAVSALKDPLEELQKHIDFEIFRGLLEELLVKPEPKGQGGRKAYDVVMMFKILILQRLYNLSDEQLEFQITDRLSFSRFLRLHLGEKIPDCTTIWRFREALHEVNGERKLFDLFGARLGAAGVFARNGSIVDATIVEVPRQRNSRMENEMIKNGVTPPEWEQKPEKLCQKDVEARWTKKHEETFYGYKDHVKTDIGTRLITAYEVTSANVHDSVVLTQLLEEEDRNRVLFADSAYKSKAMDAELKARGIAGCIHEKGVRGRLLSAGQILLNREKSRIRVLVEHVFGFMENSMNGIYLRCIGLKRTRGVIGLMNLTHNLCRYVQLLRLERVAAA
jgi:IS5 family transposase